MPVCDTHLTSYKAQFTSITNHHFNGVVQIDNKQVANNDYTSEAHDFIVQIKLIMITLIILIRQVNETTCLLKMPRL